MVKEVLFVLFILAIIPFVHATETKINIETVPYKIIFITIQEANSESYSPIKIIKTESDFIGNSLNVYTGDTPSEMKINVKVKDLEDTLFYEEFGPFNLGDTINLIVLDGNISSFIGEFSPKQVTPEIDTTGIEVPEETSNDTEANFSPPTNESSEESQDETNQSLISGAVIYPSDSLGFIKNINSNFWKIFGGIFVLVLFLIVVIFSRKTPKTPKFEKIKFNEFNKPTPPINPDEDDLDAAEKELNKAQERIQKIKGEKIQQLERKLIEESRQLQTLKGERQEELKFS